MAKARILDLEGQLRAASAGLQDNADNDASDGQLMEAEGKLLAATARILVLEEQLQAASHGPAAARQGLGAEVEQDHAASADTVATLQGKVGAGGRQLYH